MPTLLLRFLAVFAAICGLVMAGAAHATEPASPPPTAQTESDAAAQAEIEAWVSRLESRFADRLSRAIEQQLAAIATSSLTLQRVRLEQRFGDSFRIARTVGPTGRVPAARR